MKDTPPNDERISIVDLFAAQRKERRKQERKEYYKEKRFEIIHVALSAISILISLAALIVLITIR